MAVEYVWRGLGVNAEITGEILPVDGAARRWSAGDGRPPSSSRCSTFSTSGCETAPAGDAPSRGR